MLSKVKAFILSAVAAAALFSCATLAAPLVPEKITHHSDLLAKDKTFLVYLPRNYDAAKKYPVLYVLNPMGGNYSSWKSNTRIGTLLNDVDMFAVLADGGADSMYLDSPVVADSKYDSYVSQELVKYMDTHYPTIDDPKARALMGFSMGGGGAITIGIKHPDIFSLSNSFCGVGDIMRKSDDKNLQRLLGQQAGNEATWRANGALSLVQDGKMPKGIYINMYVGYSDFVLQENRDLHVALCNAKIDHSYAEHPGAHDWNFIGAHIQEALLFTDTRFKKIATWLK